MPDSQAAFGFVDNSKEKVFTSWELTTGTYLSGRLKGFFRDYFSSDEENVKWGKVEMRYFSNNTMLKILRDLQEKITAPERRKLIDEFYQYYLWVNKLEQEKQKRYI